MGYSNETNVANEMTDSRRAVKVQTMLAAPLPSEDGQIYRVHILRNETPSVVHPKLDRSLCARLLLSAISSQFKSLKWRILISACTTGSVSLRRT